MHLFFMAVPLLIYAAINLIPLVRGVMRLGNLARKYGHKALFQLLSGAWAAFIALLVAYPMAAMMTGEIMLPEKCHDALMLLGYDWMAVAVFWCTLFLVTDVLFALIRKISKADAAGKEKLHWAKNITVGAALVIFISLTNFLAVSPSWTEYDVTINKANPGHENVDMVMISDLHLGEIIREGRLQEWVDLINAEHPDIICLPGDLLDRSTLLLGSCYPDTEAVLQGLTAPLGVYASVGNHDFGFTEDDKEADLAREWVKGTGIKLLENEAIEAGGLVIAAKNYYRTSEEDTEAARFMQELVKTKPIILMDHKPSTLAFYEGIGADLTLSGHTHRGQIFPGNLITSRIYETDYGYASNGKTQLIVSSGVGTWGPLMRLGSRSELVLIHLHFKG